MMTFLPWTSLEQFYTQSVMTFFPWTSLEQSLYPVRGDIYSMDIT